MANINKIKEQCAERFTEGTGGYLVCVEETQRHDTTMEIFTGVMAVLVLVLIGVWFYRMMKLAR